MLGRHTVGTGFRVVNAVQRARMHPMARGLLASQVNVKATEAEEERPTQELVMLCYLDLQKSKAQSKGSLRMGLAVR